ncbi:MAG: glycosyl hydrolase, partial [Bacteroidia bacterium]
MKKIVLLFAAAIISNNYLAQEWVEKVQSPNANFYEVQKDFYDYFKDKDVTVKSTGYKAFKRWEYFVGPRVYPSGDIAILGQGPKNFAEFLKKNEQGGSANKFSSTSSVMSNTWISVGPFGAPTGSVGGYPRKAGRDNFLTFHPTNPSIIYAGAAGGGLWVTTNGGVSWTTNTDNLPVTAVSDLAIDPTNPNIMYLATGGGDDILSAFPVSSDGVYKTIDGGNTWLPCGLTFTLSQNRVIHRLVLDPTNPQIIFAATNAGIYRSTNGGTSFASVSTINCWDLKFHPTNPTIVYAASGSFYRSTNSGTSFTLVNTGIPSSGINRMSIAVTPTNPSNVYVLASRSSDSQLNGIYRSTNDGASFVTAATSPNIIGNSCAGTSTGAGQGWYDLAIAASPITPGEIVVGGVNIWRSTNDGTSWTCTGCWIGTGSPPYVHADIHELEYTTTGTLFSTNDGGIYSYTGSAWTDLTATRNIAQIYKIGMSALTPNTWITGHQDNGTNVRNGANYVASLAGDGMDCFIDRTNNNYMFAEQFNGSLNRSTNGGTSWLGITSGITGTGAWVTPWKQDPISANTIYCGRNQMFKSNNYGTSWTQIGTTGGGGSVAEFAIAPSNNQVIYVLYPGSIRKTIDGGTTWTNVTQTVPAGNLTFITIDPNDPNTAWVTISGYTAGSKVYQTVDGGASWMNISSNLPNLPANCSVYEPGSNDRIYIGMDIGVYYKDNSSTTWTLYNTGLPNVAIMDMETTPASPGKIYAATYGRGVYEADVIQTT